jgi:hypothetical protein
VWGSGLGAHVGSGSYALVPTKTSGWWVTGSACQMQKLRCGRVRAWVQGHCIYKQCSVMRALRWQVWQRRVSGYVIHHVIMFVFCPVFLLGRALGWPSLVGGCSYVPPLGWRAGHSVTSVRPLATVALGEGGPFVRFCWFFWGDFFHTAVPQLGSARKRIQYYSFLWLT